MKKSALIIPISILIHLMIINGCMLLLTPETYLRGYNVLYYNAAWLLITYNLNFYPTGRKEKFSTNLFKMFQLYILFGLAYFALFGIEKRENFSFPFHLSILALIFLLLTCYRWMFYYLRRKYRLIGGNYVNVVIIGRDKNLKRIRKVLDEPELGYRYMGYFDNATSVSPTYLGTIEDSLAYINSKDIDQIYCTASKLSKEELSSLISFADNNFKKLKIIPDNKDIFTRAMSIELYDTVPVLNVRGLPMDSSYSRYMKRAFDVFFSSLVIVFVLSWLVPLLYILIKLESPGPLFFSQKRNGINRDEFMCLKFRSMTLSTDADKKMATKNDMRITKIGKFIRKTSIDELPQFINVFMGHMSVVGPRPHMQSHTQEYEKSVDKYLVRHFAKPGITGLAQVKGYRGEIIRQSDIINRLRFDIFYLEKWNILWDLEIIYLTVFNIFKGEEKAY